MIMCDAGHRWLVVVGWVLLAVSEPLFPTHYSLLTIFYFLTPSLYFCPSIF